MVRTKLTLIIALILYCGDIYAQLSGYQFRKKLAVQSAQVSGSADLTDFPVLISLTDSELRSVGNGGGVNDPNGFDISFTASDGSTELDFERISYDPASGSVSFWVSFPVISPTSDTEFFLYYGNPSVNTDQSTPAVWSNDFQLVHHYDNDLSDATTNGNDGVNNGTAPATAFIGNGRLFDNSDFIQVANDATLSYPDDHTISVWVNGQNLGANPDLISKGLFNDAYSTFFSSGGNLTYSLEANFFNFFSFPLEIENSTQLQNNTWYYLTFSKEGNQQNIYLNGTLDGSRTNNFPTVTTLDPVTISSSSNAFNGLIDELRFSDVARSADWIQTEYNNQSDPASFIAEVPEVPVLSNIESSPALFFEGGAPVLITQQLDITVPFNSQITAASIQISQNFVSSEDQLNFSDQSGITGNYNPTTGELQLSGAATVINYRNAIRSITYENTNTTSPSPLSREVSISINNADGVSNTLSREVSIVVEVDDPATDVPNAVFHLDALDIDGDLNTADQPADNSPVATWGDRSDNAGASASDISFSATGSEQGLYNSLFIGQRGAILFDGTDDEYTTGNDALLNNATFTEKSFAAAFRTGDDVSGLQIVYEQGNGQRGYQISIKNGTLYAYSWSNNGGWSNGNESIPLGTVQPDETYIVIASHDANAGTWQASVNGGTILSGSGTAGTMNSVNGGALIGAENGTRDPETFGNNPGGRNNFNGLIGEILSWNSSLNSSQFASLFTYFSDKWINVPPVLSSIEGATADFNEGDPPFPITSTLTVTDSDNILLDSARISISSGYVNGEDELQFSPTASISGTFNPASGTLLLTGQDSPAAYQAALRNVLYANLNTSDPTPGIRSFTFTVFDYDEQSNSLSRDINVISVESSPQLSALETTPLTYTEGDGSVAITTQIIASDPDSPLLQSTEVRISSNYIFGEDRLNFTAQNGLTGNWNASTGVLTISGAAAPSVYTTALRSVSYRNSSPDPDTGDRSIEFVISDGTTDSNSPGRIIQVTKVNTPPQVTNNGPSSINYEGAVAFASQISVSDPDDFQLDSAFVSVSTGYVPSEDQLSYSTIYGISGTFDSATGTLTLSGSSSLTNYRDAIRSVVYSNSNSATTQTKQLSVVVDDGESNSTPLSIDIVFDPISNISGLEVWLRADAGIISSGGLISSWEDQSGNGNDYTGVAGASLPAFLSSSPDLNNQPSVSFNGDGDYFLDSDGDANYINGSDQFTVFVVYKSDLTNTDKGFFIAEQPTGEDKGIALRYDQAGANQGGSFTNVVKTGILTNSPDNQLESFSNIQSTSPQMMSLQYQSGLQYDLFIDGILNNPSAAAAVPTGIINNSNAAILGKGSKDSPDVPNSSWDGQIAEFLYFSSNLSEEDRRTVEDYLSVKYDIPIRKITAATNGENISADDANAVFTVLDGPVIKESFAGEFAAGATFVLETPAGFEWDITATPVVSTQPVYGGTTSLNVSFTSVTAEQVTFTINSASVTNPGEFSISGLGVRPTTGTLPNNGIITNSGTTGPGGRTSYGLLNMVPGAPAQLAYDVQPSTSAVDSTIAPPVRVKIQDQYTNDIELSAVAISLSLSDGTGSLSGSLSSTTNALGIAEFDNLSIDQAGTKQITASSISLLDAESDPFNIVDAGELVRFSVEQVPTGPVTTKTAGQSFSLIITALDGEDNPVSSFNGRVVVTSNCNLVTGQGTTNTFTNGVLASQTVSLGGTGLCTISVQQQNGSITGQSNEFTVNPGPASALNSLISANPGTILNDGISTSQITVDLFDEFGNELTSGGDNVILNASEGTLSSVTDNSNGTYSAELQSSTSLVTSLISGTLNGSVIEDSALVQFTQITHIWQSQIGALEDANNWFDPANWSSGTVPGPNSVVLIPSDPSVGNEYPVIDSDAEITELVVEAGATVTVSGSTTLTVNEDVNGAGEISGSNADILEVGGNLDIGAITLGNVNLVGNGDQFIGSPLVFENLFSITNGQINFTSDLEIDGTLDLSSGTLFVEDNTNLIASDIAFNGGEIAYEKVIRGPAGWRMLSSPVLSDYADFLDGTITQGYTGAFYESDTLQPNVLYYLEDYGTNSQGLPATDNDRLRAPADASDDILRGRGYWVFFFGDEPGDERYNDPLPDTLLVSGTETGVTGGEFDFGVTYTADADTGWNLVGNPFGASIDWDNEANWTKTNIESSIYIWDPAANNGNGEFLSWNGVSGSLGSGLIPSFQGFWIKATASGAQLSVSTAAKTSGGNFLRKSSSSGPQRVIELEASGNGLSKSAYFTFTQNGEVDKDERDAYRLLPFSDTVIEFYSILSDGTELDIQNLPYVLDNRIEVPLYFNAFSNGNVAPGTYRISAPAQRNLGSEWKILLTDYETGSTVDLREETYYEFTYSSSAKMKSASPQSGSPAMKKSSSSPRFSLRITSEEIEADIPESTFLSQNYPNPFNPVTTIQFGLESRSPVSITLYDVLGRKIRTLVNETRAAGNYTVSLDASGLSSGVYIYRLSTPERVLVRKLTLIK